MSLPAALVPFRSTTGRVIVNDCKRSLVPLKTRDLNRNAKNSSFENATSLPNPTPLSTGLQCRSFIGPTGANPSVRFSFEHTKIAETREHLERSNNLQHPETVRRFASKASDKTKAHSRMSSKKEAKATPAITPGVPNNDAQLTEGGDDEMDAELAEVSRVILDKHFHSELHHSSLLYSEQECVY
jgi:hypothetical protein